MKTECQFKGGMKFESSFRNHQVLMDAKTEHGGTDQGPTPKEYVLAGMCGCTGMDVVSLLKKMRVEYADFKISADAELTQGHPAVFSKVLMDYHLVGVQEPEAAQEKIIKSVTMSMSKYCGVSAMIAKSAQIIVKIYMNGNLIYEAPAVFENK